MSGQVSVRADPVRGSGYALIRVAGAAGCTDPRFRVWRSPDWPASNLGPGGWQGSESLLQPGEAAVEGADLVLAVGPAICNVLEPDTYSFALPAAGVSTPLTWPDEVQPLFSGSAPSLFAAPAPPPVPIIAPLPKAPPVITPVPAAAPAVVVPAVAAATSKAPPRRSAAAGLGLGVLVLVAILAAAAFYFRPWNKPAPIATVEPPAPDIIPPTAVAPPTPPSPPVQQAAPTPPADPDTIPVSELAQGDPAVMLAQAQKRMAAKPQDALLLLEVAGADRHYGPALAALGRLYDPALPRQGGIPADVRQAARAYRDAAGAHDDSAAPEREALRQALTQRRDAGDLAAKLTLQDFWP